ncbi:MAG: nucleotide exchange factor GrpE [Candidatus Parcubacteria bacterium]|nr:nucleotide exchange factor GrpE [Candidatus Parcubacteria bacterium]
MEEEIKKENIEESPEEVIDLEKLSEEYKSGWQRERADFLNYKNEEISRLKNVVRINDEIWMEELIAVLDSFDLALSSDQLQEGKTDKGIYLIKSQLESILKKKGLEEIKSDGTMFDPKEHEAIEEIVSDLEPGKIVETLQKGYSYNGKVLRPAKVKVSAGEIKK